MGEVEARGVTADDWRRVVRVEPREEQREFVASVAYYLSLCHYGGEWRPVALYVEDEVVGFAMWGFDAEEENYWIGGLVVDSGYQGRGYGKAAMESLLDLLSAKPGCRKVALSYEPENVVARRLYESLGFIETGERVDDEIIARRKIR